MATKKLSHYDRLHRELVKLWLEWRFDPGVLELDINPRWIEVTNLLAHYEEPWEGCYCQACCMWRLQPE